MRPGTCHTRTCIDTIRSFGNASWNLHVPAAGMCALPQWSLVSINQSTCDYRGDYISWVSIQFSFLYVCLLAMCVLGNKMTALSCLPCVSCKFERKINGRVLLARFLFEILEQTSSDATWSRWTSSGRLTRAPACHQRRHLPIGPTELPGGSVIGIGRRDPTPPKTKQRWVSDTRVTRHGRSSAWYGSHCCNTWFE